MNLSSEDPSYDSEKNLTLLAALIEPIQAITVLTRLHRGNIVREGQRTDVSIG